MSSLKERVAAQRKQIADNKAAYLRSYRFKPGKTMVRVLPGIANPEDFAVEYGAHYIKDPRDSSKVVAVVGDAEICYGKPDPVRQAISEYIHRCQERGDDQGAKNAKDWLARRTYLLNLKIIGGVDKDNAGKVVPWEASTNQYDQILSLMETMFDADKDPLDPNAGLVIVVERTGTGVQDTKYTFQAFPSPEKYPVTQEDLDARHDLAAYRDSKFGVSVTKALTALSSLLGYDVTTTAIGAAMASNAAALPSAASAPASSAPTDPVDDDLLALENVTDAEFEPATDDATSSAATPAATPAAAAADDLDSIMAELDDL